MVKTIAELRADKIGIMIQREIEKEVNLRIDKLMSNAYAEGIELEHIKLEKLAHQLGYRDIFDFLDVMIEHELSYNDIIILFDDRYDELLTYLANDEGEK